MPVGAWFTRLYIEGQGYASFTNNNGVEKDHTMTSVVQNVFSIRPINGEMSLLSLCFDYKKLF